MKYLFLAIFLFFLNSCKSLPDKKLSQFSLTVKKEQVGESDTVSVFLSNPLHTAITMKTSSKNADIQKQLNEHFPFLLQAKSDTTFYFTGYSPEDLQVSLSATMGDPADSLKLKPIRYPFPDGKKYRVIQGYNGSFSHQSDYSRYALDFKMEEKDTVSVVADGFVVGVIKDYKDGGSDRKWRDYANYITIYHPEMGVYTQYVHLYHEGSFVEVGDTVLAGQPIGLSGNTGLSTTPHLHFNVLRPTETGMIGTPVEFVDGRKGSEF